MRWNAADNYPEATRNNRYNFARSLAVKVSLMTRPEELDVLCKLKFAVWAECIKVMTGSKNLCGYLTEHENKKKYYKICSHTTDALYRLFSRVSINLP